MFDLTLEQKEILNYKGDLLVLAGPGTGKTFTILHKIKHLLEKGVPQEKIFLLTFSLKICQELREKLNSLGIKGIKVDTFHGLAYDLYREYYQREPVLISEVEKEHLLKKLSLKKKDL
ncbi:MAG: UvrD-helicase domain-containing protein, partial [Caldimicrobium sp.]